MPSLLLGAGHDRRKKVAWASAPDWTGELVTLDHNPACAPTVLWAMPASPLPFPEETFDEIGAYDCLEHWGAQGDWQGFFEEFGEYHRILKPGGRMGILVPIGEDALGDPGHTRFFHANHFAFLSQAFYARGLAAGQPLTDYRTWWRKDFEVELLQREGHHHLAVMLRKPR